MRSTLFIGILLIAALAAAAQTKPVTGYAPVNGLKMYYEIHGEGVGVPVVMIHGAFMAVTGDWAEWVAELAKTRKVIAVELQGHGRTGDINRVPTHDALATDVAALLDHLKVPQADVVGYSLGGGVAIKLAITHPEKIRKVVSISAPIRSDGWVKAANDAWPKMTADIFNGTPIVAEYKRLSPSPEKFEDFFNHIKAVAMRPFDFGAAKLKATKAPMFFVFGDADGIRIEHIAEMYRLKGGGNTHGDMQPRPASRLAVIPDTSHVMLMARRSTIMPLILDFLGNQGQ